MALTTRPKTKTHHRKRQAGHHRHSPQYLKSYWPYLPMLVIVGLGLLVNSAWSGGGVLGTSRDFSSARLLGDTNAARSKQDEPPLSLNAQLNAAAQAKADDMVKSNYWAHDSPTGKTPWTFIAASGYQYQKAGENLAYGFANADESVSGWMNSAEHRANILNASYSDVGFGVASSPNYVGQGPETVVVAEYAQPATAVSTTNPVVNAVPAAPSSDNNVLGTETAAQPVSRVQLLGGGQSEWSLLIVVTIAGAAGALFILRHGYRLHRLLNEGEAFVNRHPYLDITAVFIITAGCVLTRVSGIVR